MTATIHEDLRLLATTIRVGMVASPTEAYELACAVLTLIDRVERLTIEATEAHRHYAEAVHGEWLEKARADGVDINAARLAARAAGLAAMRPLAVA